MNNANRLPSGSHRMLGRWTRASYRCPPRWLPYRQTRGDWNLWRKEPRGPAFGYGYRNQRNVPYMAQVYEAGFARKLARYYPDLYRRIMLRYAVRAVLL